MWRPRSNASAGRGGRWRPRRCPFSRRTEILLHAARTCYDHIAGTLGVGLHDRCKALGWLSPCSRAGIAYDLTPAGAKAFAASGH